jgi:hypothetical protein
MMVYIAKALALVCAELGSMVTVLLTFVICLKDSVGRQKDEDICRDQGLLDTRVLP